MAFDPAKPYNTLPPLPPKADIESRAILKACIEARAAVAALKQACTLIPNAGVLINTIPLMEAQASSEIENIVTTTDELFRHAQNGAQAADSNTKEALRYRTALRQGVDSLHNRPLCTATAEAVCTTIKDVVMTVRRVPGTTLSNRATGKVIYTPPAGEALLREKLANWERFIHEDTEIDPLIRMAVAHYQFEAIHPFTDGNGRTGRILNQLMLVEQKLLDMPVLYLSRYIIANRNDYYQLLLGVTEKAAWEKWILYMLKGISETATWTGEKINAVRMLMTHTADHVRESLPKVYSRELVELTFVQPYCRIQNLVESGLGHRETASKYLKDLAQLGVLQEVQSGREKLFIHPKFVQLLKSNTHEFPSYDKPRRTRAAAKPAARKKR